MAMEIHPNQRRCPVCSGWDIAIEDGNIWCESCTANFIDPRWARSEEENHVVTFDGFEDHHAAAEVMQVLAGLRPR